MILNGDVHACVEERKKKSGNAKGVEGGTVRATAGRREGREGGRDGGGRGGGRRAALEPQECENVLQFRNQACLLVCAKARYRKPPTGGLRTAPASAAKADCGSVG